MISLFEGSKEALLDWEKAFDKVDRTGLMIALEREGVDDKLISIIRNNSLRDLKALENLSEVEKFLQINGNNELVNLLSMIEV